MDRQNIKIYCLKILRSRKIFPWPYIWKTLFFPWPWKISLTFPDQGEKTLFLLTFPDRINPERHRNKVILTASFWRRAPSGSHILSILNFLVTVFCIYLKIAKIRKAGLTNFTLWWSFWKNAIKALFLKWRHR